MNTQVKKAIVWAFLLCSGVSCASPVTGHLAASLPGVLHALFCCLPLAAVVGMVGPEPGAGTGRLPQWNPDFDMGFYQVLVPSLLSNLHLEYMSCPGQLHKILPEKPQGLVQVVNSPCGIFVEVPFKKDWRNQLLIHAAALV